MCFNICVGECIDNVCVCFSEFGDSMCDFGCLHRTHGEMLLLPPVISFTPTTTTTHQWLAQYNTKVRLLSSPLSLFLCFHVTLNYLRCQSVHQ